MALIKDRYGKYARRRRRRAARTHKRLDVQGLRMVAVLTVLANHLWGWPHGGFVGVDVFFVISGFLITGNLLRDAETRGTVSFGRFYLSRARRIIPAATVVLALTVLAAYLVFLPFRAREVGIDAWWAFIFMSNWWFGIQGTDYFQAARETVSPLQHYWSLSIEEQFYFVWPALIFLVSVLVLRKAWTHARRMQLAGVVMAGIVVVSLAWALYQTATDPAWAYFNTFARIWELGVGALLATAVGALARIPHAVRPVLSWAGLALIAASLFLITDDSAGFPAPWAMMPVAGAALVIAAGVGGEPKYQAFLRNPLSGYIGDISYSLYLVHWPVIVILAAIIDPGPAYTVSVLALSFGLAVGSYHFVENPWRRANWSTFRASVRDIRRRRFQVTREAQRAALAALALLAVAGVTLVAQHQPPAVPIEIAAADPADQDIPEPAAGPSTAALQQEIVEALKTAEWPNLDPTMEAVIQERPIAPGIAECGRGVALPWDQCTWGSPDAATRIMIVGDSIALGYAGPLRDIALNSGGTIQLHTAAVTSCAFAADLIVRNTMPSECGTRKQQAVDLINTVKPDVVIISNMYDDNEIVGMDGPASPQSWSQTLRQIIDQFRPSTGRVVLLSAPPQGPPISECYGARSSTPADCVTRVNGRWRDLAATERQLAESVGGVWIDSRPWFCKQGMCPAFVGSTPTKSDGVHFSIAYGQKIVPAMVESLVGAGVIPA